MKKSSSKKKTEKSEIFECVQCSRSIQDAANALFVEEENGRIFCSEKCIVEFFAPEIATLEEKYFTLLRKGHDFTADEREKLSYLRWNALEHPDEVWCEKINGDLRYTLIGEYDHEGDNPQSPPIKTWCVCITLLLRGEPSFLYLAFVSKDAQLVEAFRVGEKIVMEKPAGSARDANESRPGEVVNEDGERIPFDGLATPWTREETLIAETVQERTSDDIQYEDFSKYDHCVEATLQSPDEVWRRDSHYHFIKRYKNDPLPYWYIIVAKETEQDDQLEIVDAFPTRDENLAGKFRVGSQENIEDDSGGGTPASDAAGGGRMIH